MSKMSKMSKMSTDRKDRFTLCLGCGNDDYGSDTFFEYEIRDLDEKIWQCESCREDMIGYLHDENPWTPAPNWRTFLARPLRKKSNSDRYTFNSIEEFEEWCTDEEDFINEVGYTFGVSNNRALSPLECKEWLTKGYVEEDIYWLDLEGDPEDDPEDWKKLVNMIRNGDCDFSSLESDGVVLNLDLPKYYDFLMNKMERTKILIHNVIDKVCELRG